MKINILLVAVFGSMLFACQKNKDTPTITVELQFNQRWGNDPVGPESLSQFNFINTAGETLSIERLRYLFSKISLDLKDGTQYALQDYQFIDVSKNDKIELTYTPDVTVEEVVGISMLFGLDRTYNQDGVYPDLNAAVWNVPQRLGGGITSCSSMVNSKKTTLLLPLGTTFMRFRQLTQTILIN